MLRLIHIILLIFFIVPCHTGAAEIARGDDLYNSLIAGRDNNKTGETGKLAYRFLKKFPLSRHVPDVRLLLAEIENDMEKSISLYRVVIDKYRYYEKRDFALYRICDIYSLRSDWSLLKSASLEGLRLFKDSAYIDEFRMFYVLSLINTDRLYAAGEECKRILRNSNSYTTLSKTLIMLTYINRKTSGLSRNYIFNLKEMIIGYRDSYSHPSAIYFIGRFYESKGDFSRAYSAYIDILNKYPRSIESLYAYSRSEELKKHKPVLINYIPGNAIIDKTENVDISPEIDINDRDGRNSKQGDSYYTVEVGPMRSLSNLKKIKKDLADFGNSKSVRMKEGYILFVGNYSNMDDASRTRIRLAEEYGINGKIIRVSSSGNKKYLYED